MALRRADWAELLLTLSIARDARAFAAAAMQHLTIPRLALSPKRATPLKQAAALLCVPCRTQSADAAPFKRGNYGEAPGSEGGVEFGPLHLP